MRQFKSGPRLVEGKYYTVSPSGCWEWTKRRDRQGYGRTQCAHRGSAYLAHRLAWEESRGPIPDGMCVLHRCDNPGCINPDHLFLGTKADNTADMMAKKRNRCAPPRGTATRMCRLTEAQVLEIRDLYDRSAMPLGLIGTIYGISPGNVFNIGARRSWKWLPESTALDAAMKEQKPDVTKEPR